MGSFGRLHDRFGNNRDPGDSNTRDGGMPWPLRRRKPKAWVVLKAAVSGNRAIGALVAVTDAGYQLNRISGTAAGPSSDTSPRPGSQATS